jgi:hypothetical protein
MNQKKPHNLARESGQRTKAPCSRAPLQAARLPPLMLTIEVFFGEITGLLFGF